MAINANPTLESFLNELSKDLSAVSGIRFAPNDPPEDLSQFPVAVPYSSSGTIKHAPQNLITYLHSVQIAVLTARKDLPKDNEIMIPLIELVIEKIFVRLTADGTMYADLETLGDANESASYTYGEITWGGLPFLGYIISLNNVKIQRVLG